jgi:uncharacterized protein YciI
MKYFLVLIEYKTDIENIVRVTEQHRAHLKKGYEQGMFLISGPRIPRTGGLVIAKSSSLEQLESFFSDDPYYIHSYAEYKFIEFDPKSCHSDVTGWVTSTLPEVLSDTANVSRDKSDF